MSEYYITYNSITSLSKGLYIRRRPDVPAPEPVYEPYEIPGRDGYLMPAGITHAPIEIPVEMNFMADSKAEWADSYRAARAWLLGKESGAKLIMGDDTDYFYKVYAVRIEELARESYKIGSFTAVFVCDPYQYLVSGETAIAGSSSLTNSYEESHPLYYINATGSWTLTVNGNSFTGSGVTYIDTNKMIAYDASYNIVNTATAGDFEDLYLTEGTNTFSLSSGTFTITPRWRVL